MPPSREKLLSVAHDFLHQYNEWTVASVMKLRAPNCVHYILPRSQGNPPRNNDEFSEFLGPIISVFRNFSLNLIDERETIVDEQGRKVSLHLQSTADTDVGPYANEYIFTIRVTEDGTMIDEIIEFLDSGYTLDFVKRLKG